MTQVINLFGGPGSGKSTLAASLFSNLKLKHKNVELVTEYVKEWAYSKHKISEYDQFYIAGNQAHRESILYGKVDYVITDSPILLCSVYEMKYAGTSVVLPSILKFLQLCDCRGVKHKNFFVERPDIFNQTGRYENEEESKQIDRDIKELLKDNNIKYKVLSTSISQLDKIAVINKSLGIK